MLDLVPLAGARREMTDRNHQSRLLGQLLELPFPEAETGTVAATTIGGDEERRGAGVVVATQFAPPAPDRSPGGGSRVGVPPPSAGPYPGRRQPCRGPLPR